MAESLPGDFPPLTLPNMRALCALSALSSKEQEQEQLIRAFDALYHAYFVDSKQTHKPDVLPGVLQEALGEELSKKGATRISAAFPTPFRTSFVRRHQYVLKY